LRDGRHRRGKQHRDGKAQNLWRAARSHGD
jgi:hypothetical protein